MKLVKLPAFDGTHDGFQRWWMRFKAYASVHKFVQALTPGISDSDLPHTDGKALDSDADVAVSQSIARRRSDIAMA